MIKKQQGLSIVECLLAISFASALIWQVFIIYKDVHHTHQLQSSMSHLLHHGQWFEDVMGQRIRSAGDKRCLPKGFKNNALAVQGFLSNRVPADWSVHAATNTEVLILGQCQKSNPSQLQSQWLQTAYYLKKNSRNKLYTLYQKQKGIKAMAMQDDIQSLNWYMAFQTSQKGALTAPQALGVSNTYPIQAIAWKVVFSSSQKILVHINKPMIRIFYGYMTLHNLLK
jgi:type II secretory pathway component PulJ